MSSPPEPPEFWTWLRRWYWVVLRVAVVMATGLLAWKLASRPPASGIAVGSVKTNPADGQPYVWIPPGSLQMGCSPGDSECYDWEKPAHRVSISKGFWMGQTVITQSAYEKVMGNDPSNFKGPQQPVEKVTWQKAGDYCKAVGGRLPTEAEWEYAARAGNTKARYGDLNAIAWYNANSGNSTKPVRTKQPNAWVLYDMLGNVYEWCQDWYGSYRSGEQTDPKGPGSAEHRVVRGGSWYNSPRSVRVSYRYWVMPEVRSYVIGFRCVREVIP